MIAGIQDNKRIRCWSIDTGDECQLVPTVFTFLKWFEPLPDGKRLIVFDKGIHVLDLGSGTIVNSYQKEVEGYTSALSSDGRAIASDLSFSAIGVWDVDSLRLTQVSEGHEGEILAISFSPDNKMVATVDHAGAFRGVRHGTIRIWDTVSGRLLRKWGSGGVGRGSYSTAAFLPEGNKVVAQSFANRSLCLLDSATNAAPRVVNNRVNDHLSLFFASFSGRRIVDGTSHFALKVWDIEHRNLQRTIDVPCYLIGVSLLRLSPCGHYVSVPIGATSVGIWDVDTGNKLFVCSHNALLHSIAFSPSGRSVAISCADGTIHIWEMLTGKKRAVFHVPKGRHSVLAFSNGGAFLAVGGKDQQLSVIDLHDHTHHVVFRGHTDSITAIAFSSDNKRIASGSQDTTVLLWDLESSWLQCRKTPVAVSTDELKLQWKRLASADGMDAFQAIQALSIAMNSIGFFDEMLRPIDIPEAVIKNRIQGLDSDVYNARELASRELAKYEGVAIGPLRRFLLETTSLDAKRRAQDLITRYENREYPPSVIQFLRGMEVLEAIRTPDSRKLLHKLAQGSPSSLVTKTAIDTLSRVEAPAMNEGQ